MEEVRHWGRALKVDSLASSLVFPLPCVCGCCCDLSAPCSSLLLPQLPCPVDPSSGTVSKHNMAQLRAAFSHGILSQQKVVNTDIQKVFFCVLVYPTFFHFFDALPSVSSSPSPSLLSKEVFPHSYFSSQSDVYYELCRQCVCVTILFPILSYFRNPYINLLLF